MSQNELAAVLEAVLLAASRPLTPPQLQALFPEDERPALSELRKGLRVLSELLEGRGIELKEVASGFRLQVRAQYSAYVARLQQEKAPRYSRALLETLVLIAYRQPITRGEIEAVRGVAVSSQIMRTLVEREWVQRVGHRDLPGRPGLYATTRQFLDYFNLKSLEQLPPLTEFTALEAADDDAVCEAQPLMGETGDSPAEDEASEQFFSELDQLEKRLPDNFEALLQGHFSSDSEH